MMAARTEADNSISYISFGFLLMAILIIARLFILQILQHDYYATMALSSHEIYKKIHPTRGEIYFQDTRSRQEYPAAVSRQYYLVFVSPREIAEADMASTSKALAEILQFDATVKKTLQEKILAGSKERSAYYPVAKKVNEATAEQIKNKKIKGVYMVAQEHRYYPENNLGANILGFLGQDKDGNPLGNYGAEGYWDKILAGKSGFLLGERGALGNWISLAGRTSVQAVDGADLFLTIDRTLEYRACDLLRKGFEDYGAKSAALVMMNPKTGAILAMCSFPDFDPNNYSQVDSLNAYNNTSIFTPYEPGSVFKPITMAAALDLGLLEPNTTFVDPCTRKIDNYTIHNALNKCYGEQTMTGVLENSINTGMIWVEEKIGRERFGGYVKRFGFGEKTGIDLDTEAAGNISSFDQKSKIHAATASFGQGLTVTPLQLAAAYGALANGGQLYKPYVVAEVRYPNGQVIKTQPQVVSAVISPRAAKLITGMLVSVVEKGHGRAAKVADYYLAGKTGTAQIPGPGGYSEETNHTFAGFAPADDPQFVLIVKYEAPKRAWAESTAAPVFRNLMDFAFDYYGLPNER